MNFTDENHIGRLIVEYLNGQLDGAGQTELKRWLSESERNRNIFRRMTSLEYMTESVERYVKDGEGTEREWARITAATIHRKRAFSRCLAGYAAAAVVLVGVGVGIFNLVDKNAGEATGEILRYSEQPVLIMPDGRSIGLPAGNVAENILPADEQRSFRPFNPSVVAMAKKESPNAMFYHTLKIPRGTSYTMDLPDGSVVHLNVDSELTFPTKFATTQRKVFLRKGEAYFDIVPDATSPFIVDVGPVSVEVLGTTFLLRAYENEESIHAVLESGSVKILANNGEITLIPSQEAVFNRMNGTLDVGQADLARVKNWMSDRIRFDNVPLREILRDLARIYAFKVEFADEDVGNIPFSINVNKKGSFREILGHIEATEKVFLEIRGNLVTAGKR